MSKTKPVELSERDVAILNYRKAQKEYYSALERLNWVDGDMFDIANEEVSVALMKFNVEAKKVKAICGGLPDSVEGNTPCQK